MRSAFAAAGLAAAACVGAVAQDENRMSGNPVFPGWYADPEAVIFGRDDRFWIYPTYSAPYDEQLHFDAFSSRDLVRWEKHERILSADDVKWARRAMWAPSRPSDPGTLCH